MLEIKPSFFDLNIKLCLPRALYLNGLAFPGVFNEDIQDSNPHFPNYQILYIYIGLEEVDFIVCDCFLSNPFLSYELGGC